MTPEDTLVELLARVGAGGTVFITKHELDQWPPGAVSAMKAQGLIGKAPPAKTVECPGCEDDCAMPVETIPDSSDAPALFVVCDKRSDINRVVIPPDHLVQWQASTIAIARFVGESFSLRGQGTTANEGNTLEIGIVKGRKKSQMLCLRSAEKLVLAAGSSDLPLTEAVTFENGRYGIDVSAVEQLVNNSTTSDSRYTPSSLKRETRKLDTQARNEIWQKEYRRRKKRHPGCSDSWCAIQISKMEIADGKSSETIRKNMK